MFKSLDELHSKLKLAFGSFQEELPEQKITFNNLTGKEKVLEIGGNIGRNSLIIGSILAANNNNNFVVLESDTNIYNQLLYNRNINNLNFNIENAALSTKTIIQNGWTTIPSPVLLDGYKFVNIISYENLINKYNIDFDTLILDCEGAFYYILKDMEYILNNINMIIMENDYTDLQHKLYVDNILIKNNFLRSYVERGGWGCCENCFYEVWKKMT